MPMLTHAPQSACRSEKPSRWQGILQRKCACGGNKQPEDEQRKSPLLQRKAQRPVSDDRAPDEVEMALRSGGEALPEELRQHFENSFGHDFSRVRIHTDSLAARSAGAVGARAFTVGSDIVFNSGEFQPRSMDGRHLLAHELTHVVQQSAMLAQTGTLRVGAPDSRFEREADSVANRIGRAPLAASATGTIAASAIPRAAIGGISAAPAVIQRVGECAGRSFRNRNCNGTPCRTAANEPGSCQWTGITNGCVCYAQYRPAPPVTVPVPSPASDEETSRARARMPEWLAPVLTGAALLAIAACFATGVCEVGGLVLAAGAATAAVIVGVLRAAGVDVREGGASGSEA